MKDYIEQQPLTETEAIYKTSELDNRIKDIQGLFKHVQFCFHIDGVHYVETYDSIYRIIPENDMFTIARFTNCNEDAPELKWSVTVEYDLERIKKLFTILNKK